MESVDNNQFEVVPNSKTKRRLPASCSNVFLNPALDLLANEDPICNTKMEVIPNKKRKRTRSLDIASFENTALDTGISKAAVNEFLRRELNNVRKNVKDVNIPKNSSSHNNVDFEDVDPVYANFNSSDPCLAYPRDSRFKDSLTQEIGIPTNSMDMSVDLDSGMDDQNVNPSITFNEISAIEPVKAQPKTINQIFVNNQTNLSLSFIDRLTDSASLSNQSLYLDDDLNESNIMEIKTITIITKKKRFIEKKKNTNPFLNGSLEDEPVEDVTSENPFLYNSKPEYTCNSHSTQIMSTDLVPRRLFDNNSSLSTLNEGNYSLPTENLYENIDSLRAESPIYENINDVGFNKQSKILGHDVSQFNATDILNLNKLSANCSNESNDSKKDLAHKFLKAGKLSKKVFKKIKKTFKQDKVDQNVTTNPYEVPRKLPKVVPKVTDTGIENPCLKLDNSDEIEMEELEDEEHQYETVKTLRNTQFNTNVTPLKERVNDRLNTSQKTTPSKKTVRFDSTLNREKVITGDSFDCEMQSPGFDAKIDTYHDELENCINERKFLRQNM